MAASRKPAGTCPPPQEPALQLGPQHRTAVALGLVIGIVLGAIGAGSAVFIMMRGADTADVSDATVDARAACDLVDRTPPSQLRDTGGVPTTVSQERLVAAWNLADGAARQNPAYRPLELHLRRVRSAWAASLRLTPAAASELERARTFCDAH